MFTYVLRAIVLIGVLGWYSTGVWKMIDTYFKDRFEKYLREEFIKYPRMKTDLDKYRAKQKGIDGTEQTVPSEVKAVDSRNTGDHNNGSNGELIGEDDVSDTMKAQFADETSEMGKRNSTIPSFEEHNNIRSPQNHENKEIPAKVAEEKPKQSIQPKNNKIIGQPKSVGSSKKKNHIKIITFTDEDFRMRKLGIPNDYDFSEFDCDEKSGESVVEVPEGIHIDDLPFKPIADLSHLDIVTQDEYCPFNLDDQEDDCKSTKEWP